MVLIVGFTSVKRCYLVLEVGKTAIFELIVFSVNNRVSEIRPDIYWTHLYWLTVLEEQKPYRAPRKSWRSASPPLARK